MPALFEYRVLDEWRRIGPADQDVVQTTPRPHLVPLTDAAEKSVIADAAGWLGHTGLCPGQARVGGAWKYAYRFIELPEAEAPKLIADLSDMITLFFERTRRSYAEVGEAARA